MRGLPSYQITMYLSPRESLSAQQLFQFMLDLESRLSQESNVKDLERQYNFLKFDWLSQNANDDQTVRDLLSFIYEKRRFHRSEPALLNEAALYPLSAIKNRQGHNLVIGTLICALAETAGQQISFLEQNRFAVLKYYQSGEPFYYDFNQGHTYSTDDLLTRLNQDNDSFKPFSFYQLMKVYVQALLGHYRKQHDVNAVIAVLDTVLDNFPSEVDALGERAYLNHQLGRYEEAQRDLQRYSTFGDLEKAPAPLRKILWQTQPDPQNIELM